MRKIILTFTLLSALSLGTEAQSFSWARQYAGTLNTVEWAADSAIDANGNTYFLGTTNVNLDQTFSDIILLKYSKTGTLLWQRTFDGEAHGQDTAFALAVSSDGYVYVAGRTVTLFTSSDFVTIKYQASDGALVWSRRFDGPISSIDEALGIAADGFGNVIVTGEAYDDHVPYTNGDFCTVKYDAAGNVVWSKLYDGPSHFMGAHDQAHSVVVDHNGDVVISGDSPDVNNNGRISTIKYRGSDGLELWNYRTELMPLSGSQIALKVASNNDVVVGGNSQDNGLQVFMIRINSLTGLPVWTVRDSFPHGGRLVDRSTLAIDKDDNLAVSVTYDPDTDNSNLNYNIQTAKYRFSDGVRQWSVSYGNSNRLDAQGAKSVTMDGSGNVIVAGSNLVATQSVVSVWKFAALDGHLLWRGEYDGPREPDAVNKVSVDKFGNIYVTGITGVDVGTGNSDLQIVMFGVKNLRLVGPGTRIR